MTNVNANVDIDRLAREVAEDTACNDHCGALVRLCEGLPCLRDYRSMAKMVQTTHRIEGQMSASNRKAREDLFDFMKSSMFAQLTPADYKQLMLAL